MVFPMVFGWAVHPMVFPMVFGWAVHPMVFPMVFGWAVHRATAPLSATATALQEVAARALLPERKWHAGVQRVVCVESILPVDVDIAGQFGSSSAFEKKMKMLADKPDADWVSVSTGHGRGCQQSITTLNG